MAAVLVMLAAEAEALLFNPAAQFLLAILGQLLSEQVVLQAIPALAITALFPKLNFQPALITRQILAMELLTLTVAILAQAMLAAQERFWPVVAAVVIVLLVFLKIVITLVTVAPAPQ